MTPSAAVPDGRQSRQPSLTVFGWLDGLLAHAGLLLAVPLILAAAAAGLTFLITPRYSAVARFYPEAASTSGLPAGLAGLADRFGVSVGTEPRQSAEFYAALLQTRRVLDRLLQTRFARGGQGDSATLLEQLDLPGEDPARVLERGARLLRDRIGVSIDRRTGVGTLVAQLGDRTLAADVANECVGLMNWYNRTTRQSQARERRQFTEDRVRDVGRTLGLLEDSLRQFYEANALWEASPRLRFEESRLSRRVRVQEGLFTSLQEELETAKIAEVNEAPVVSLVDPAVVPTRRSWPRRRLIVGGTWLVSLLGLVGIVSFYHYRSYLLAGDPEGVAALRSRLAVVRRAQ